MSRTNKTTLFLAFMAVMSSSLISAAAFAQPLPDPVPRVTEPPPPGAVQSAPQSNAFVIDRAAVEKFYADSVAAQLAGIDETVAFLKKHAHEKLEATMKVISRVHGAPQVQKEEWTLDKRQLILKMKEGARNARVKSLKTNLLSVKFSDDGKQAKVKNTTFGVSLVRMASPEGEAMLMTAEQSMFCDDVLNLGPGGLIQYETSHCNAELTFEPKN